LYGSTSCWQLYKPWAKSMGEGDFRPSTARRPLDRFSWNLKYITTFRTRPGPPHAKFQGPTSTWVVLANSQFDALKFLSFFSFIRHAHRSHFWTHPNAQYVIMLRSNQGSAFWGLERLNLKFDPLYPQKNVKIGTLSWRSMEYCSRPNSGTVSCSNLVHGSTTQVASRDMTPKVKRSKIKFTT